MFLIIVPISNASVQFKDVNLQTYQATITFFYPDLSDEVVNLIAKNLRTSFGSSEQANNVIWSRSGDEMLFWSLRDKHSSGTYHFGCMNSGDSTFLFLGSLNSASTKIQYLSNYSNLIFKKIDMTTGQISNVSSSNYNPLYIDSSNIDTSLGFSTFKNVVFWQYSSPQALYFCNYADIDESTLYMPIESTSTISSTNVIDVVLVEDVPDESYIAPEPDYIEITANELKELNVSVEKIEQSLTSQDSTINSNLNNIYNGITYQGQAITGAITQSTTEIKDTLTTVPSQDTINNGLDDSILFNHEKIEDIYPVEDSDYDLDFKAFKTMWETGLKNVVNTISFDFNGKNFIVDISSFANMYPSKISVFLALISDVFFVWQTLKEIERVFDAYNEFDFVQISESIKNVHYTDIF